MRAVVPQASRVPASHWSTWGWWPEGAVRKDCDPGTETFGALWAGSAVEVIVPEK